MLRRMNTRAVLRRLRGGEAGNGGTLESGPGEGRPDDEPADGYTLTQLSRATGLSRQTVEAVLGDLADRGLVSELAPAGGGTGRPARRYAFRADAGFVIGQEIGAAHLRTVLADLNGTPVADDRQELPEDLPAARRLARARARAVSLVDARGLAPSAIRAAAAGTPGVVDRSGRVTRSTRVPGWTGLDLAGQMEGWFGCRGLAGNDANLAAVAEHWRGAAGHVQDVAYVLTGNRAGHGVLLGGRLHTGRAGTAGELGGFPLADWEDSSLILAREGRTAAEVFDSARRGEAAAGGIVDRLARSVALGAAALVRVVDPELVVVGGVFAPAGETLLKPLRRHLDDFCLSAPEVAASQFGEEAVALGAVRVALEHVEQAELAG